MIQFLKIKDKISQFVGKYEVYVFAVCRFVVAYLGFLMINIHAGYNEALRELPIPLILALLCSFLPSGVTLFFGAGLILIHFYALSIELCAITGAILLLMFFCYFRFTSRKGIYGTLTPVLGVFGFPYVMPVVTGLISEPYTVISVVCGEVMYFIVKNVKTNAALFSNAELVSTKSLLTLTATTILKDQEMYLYLASFIVAGVVVYCVRKLKIDHAHQIAAAVGIAVQLVMIGIGEISAGASEKMLPVIAGCIVSLIIAEVVGYSVRSLDYSRVEHLQFEDDEYYYYVKAVPKSRMSADDKQVKEIHVKKSRQRFERKKKHADTDPVETIETSEDKE